MKTAAVSGAHRTGKTTLLEELSRSLPGYTVVEEPYRQLEEDRRWRRRVDEELREIVVADRRDLGLAVIEVAGTARERARQVLAHIRRLR
jgi:predicted ATPase